MSAILLLCALVQIASRTVKQLLETYILLLCALVQIASWAKVR